MRQKRNKNTERRFQVNLDLAEETHRWLHAAKDRRNGTMTEFLLTGAACLDGLDDWAADWLYQQSKATGLSAYHLIPAMVAYAIGNKMTELEVFRGESISNPELRMDGTGIIRGERRLQNIREDALRKLSLQVLGELFLIGEDEWDERAVDFVEKMKSDFLLKKEVALAMAGVRDDFLDSAA